MHTCMHERSRGRAEGGLHAYKLHRLFQDGQRAFLRGTRHAATQAAHGARAAARTELGGRGVLVRVRG